MTASYRRSTHQNTPACQETLTQIRFQHNQVPSSQQNTKALHYKKKDKVLKKLSSSPALLRRGEGSFYLSLRPTEADVAGGAEDIRNEARNSQTHGDGSGGTDGRTE